MLFLLLYQHRSRSALHLLCMFEVFTLHLDSVSLEYDLHFSALTQLFSVKDYVLVFHHIFNVCAVLQEWLWLYVWVLSSLLLCFFSPGCCSDTEADSVFKMADNTQNITYRRSVSITPKSSTSFNQFLPTKDKSSGYVPAPLRKKRAERNEDSRHSWASASTEDEHVLTRYCWNTRNGKYLKLFVVSAHLSLNMKAKRSEVLQL